MHHAEIIAPGGSYTKAIVAAENGAEAVYVGVPFTSLRMRQNKVRDFSILKQTIAALHERGVKAYMTMNIFPRNLDMKIFESVVEKVADLGPDAIIFSDPGTFSIIRKYLPSMPLHLSTQTNMLNYEAVRFWYDLGVKRIILARELTLKEIAEMKQRIPGVELEAFVHGAMCIAYSGRCLMGEYFSGRDGNKGECSHVCRYKFRMKLEEEKRPGKRFEVGEDEEGSYMMSSKDLCTIERLAEIIPHLDGLKIEGRSKSELYVGAVAKAYRHVRDAIVNKTTINESVQNLVYQIPHRPYWEGFFFNDIRSAPDGENAEAGTTKRTPGPVAELEYCGMVTDSYIENNGEKIYEFVPKQSLRIGDKIKVLSDQGLRETTIEQFYKKNMQTCDSVTCNSPRVYLKTNIDLNPRTVFCRENDKTLETKKPL